MIFRRACAFQKNNTFCVILDLVQIDTYNCPLDQTPDKRTSMISFLWDLENCLSCTPPEEIKYFGGNTINTIAKNVNLTKVTIQTLLSYLFSTV